MRNVAAVEAAIDKLKELQRGWDSYGADPVDLSPREAAKRFIDELARSLGSEYANPVVGPTPDGGVALIWRKPYQPKVEVFFSTEGSRFVVFRDRKVLDEGPLTSFDFIKRYVTP